MQNQFTVNHSADRDDDDLPMPGTEPGCEDCPACQRLTAAGRSDAAVADRGFYAIDSMLWTLQCGWPDCSQDRHHDSDDDDCPDQCGACVSHCFCYCPPVGQPCESADCNAVATRIVTVRNDRVRTGVVEWLCDSHTGELDAQHQLIADEPIAATDGKDVVASLWPSIREQLNELLADS